MHFKTKFSGQPDRAMTLFRSVLCIYMASFCSLSHASPPDVVKMFFGPDGIEDKLDQYHGEMLQYHRDNPTLGESLESNVEVSYRQLMESGDRAVYAVTTRNSESEQDWYVYLVKVDDDWKLSAIRVLATTGIYYHLIDEYEQKISKSEEEEWQYQNALIVIKSDRELKQYLVDNLEKFKEIVKSHSSGDKEGSEKIVRELYLNSIGYTNGLLNVNIGGLVDNAVGYFFVPKNRKPPSMHQDEYIYIEAIVDGWYLYKTT